MVTKGFKTSEFYVVLAVLVPWVCNQLGIDISALIQGVERMQQEAQGSDLPVAVAGIFVAARAWLKSKK